MSQPALDRAIAERSLYEFVRQAWPVIEPVTPFAPGWHIEAICAHLEAVSGGRVKNLAITVPPGCTKSLTVCVFWPAWEWLHRPARRWLFASYSGNLVLRDAVRSRRLIDSPWYQSLWGGRYQLTSDQNVKSRYENDKTGVRISTSVGGGATGEKGDILVVDDPHNVKEVESDAIRRATLEWWDQAFYNRVNDYKTGSRVVIAQRTHFQDLIGHIIDGGEFEHLNIPEEYDPESKSRTSLGWEDPRREPGEWMRPDRFSEDEARSERERLGSFGYAAQHQQRPLPRSGGMFKREWFAVVDAAPKQARRVRYWDKAGTEGGGDYSAGVMMARSDDGIFYVEDVVRGQWSSRQRNEVMQQTAEMDAAAHGRVTVWVEQEPGSGGKESAEFTVRQLAGHDVHAERATGEKAARAQPLSAQCEAGNVRLVRGAWNRAYVDELCVFPMGKHDDQVDASSGAFNKLALTAFRRAMVW